MKKVWSLRTIVILSLVAVFLFSAAAPVQARTELVRLTLVNRTSGNIYLSLKGPALYYLSVGAEESQVFTVKRGTYTSSITACGVTSTDSLDMTSQKKLIMPVCGGRAHGAHGAATKVDLSEQIKIVPFTIINSSDTQLLAVLTGWVFLAESLSMGKRPLHLQKKACPRITEWAGSFMLPTAAGATPTAAT